MMAKATLLVAATAISTSCGRESLFCQSCSKPSELELSVTEHAAELVADRAAKRRGARHGGDLELDGILHAKLGIDAADTCEILRAGTFAARAGGEKEFKRASTTAERLCVLWTTLAENFDAPTPGVVRDVATK